MPRYIAFLRAINVGGHVVPMARLKELFTELGFSAVETFIASGNVIFETKSQKARDLEKKIERHLETALGYKVATFLRTPAEVAAVSALQPFGETDHTLSIGFMAEPLSDAQTAAVLALRTELDEFQVHGREVYWLCRVRQSESKVNNMAFERKVKVQVTFRGANTVVRLAARFPAH